MEIEGKNFIVTGGAKGIGRCIVESLLEKGAQVGIFDIQPDALETLKREHPEVEGTVCDITDNQQVESAVETFFEKYQRIDGLVNNAGMIYSSPLISFSMEGLKKHDIAKWNQIIATDLSSVFYMTLAVVEKMMINRTKGIIVNISSVCAAGNPGQSAYSAAKAGVDALTKTWAKELGTMGIRVVGVAPGFTDTASTAEAVSEKVLKDWVRRVPLKRLGRPQEIADGVIGVIENDFFNGKILELDGGLVI